MNTHLARAGVFRAAIGVACLCDANPAQAQAPVSEKAFQWTGELRAGDCGQVEATLVLQSDGHAHFRSATYTYETHTGDYWWSSFQLQDASGVNVQVIPYHRGPRMDDGSPPPRYHFDFDFDFNPANFNSIENVSYRFKC
jgi:hypothetical protein